MPGGACAVGPVMLLPDRHDSVRAGLLLPVWEAGSTRVRRSADLLPMPRGLEKLDRWRYLAAGNIWRCIRMIWLLVYAALIYYTPWYDDRIPEWK